MPHQTLERVTGLQVDCIPMKNWTTEGGGEGGEKGKRETVAMAYLLVLNKVMWGVDHQVQWPMKLERIAAQKSRL